MKCTHLLLFTFVIVHMCNLVSGEKREIRWVEATQLAVEGRAWTEGLADVYDRLPAATKGVVRDEIWKLAKHSSGILVHFTSNTTHLYVQWSINVARYSMPHMPSTGVSGVDLYIKDDGKWRWIKNGRPAQKIENQATLLTNLSAEEREYILYLPLYNAVRDVRIGVDNDAEINGVVRKEKPIVFYGTSITQGACASRPGMSYPAILGRALDMPIINLGFSGNGRMEPEFMKFFVEIEDAAVFVIDTLPNMSPSDVAERYEQGIALLRSRHPQTPIVMVENIVYTDSWLIDSRERRQRNSSATIREIFERLSAKDSNLYYVTGQELLGDDGEGTVDGTHPNDLGMMRIANHLEPVLRKILNK